MTSCPPNIIGITSPQIPRPCFAKSMRLAFLSGKESDLLLFFRLQIGFEANELLFNFINGIANIYHKLQIVIVIRAPMTASISWIIKLSCCFDNDQTALTFFVAIRDMLLLLLPPIVVVTVFEEPQKTTKICLILWPVSCLKLYIYIFFFFGLTIVSFAFFVSSAHISKVFAKSQKANHLLFIIWKWSLSFYGLYCHNHLVHRAKINMKRS